MISLFTHIPLKETLEFPDQQFAQNIGNHFHVAYLGILSV
jgi:hypothetical protein